MEDKKNTVVRLYYKLEININHYIEVTSAIL